MIQISFSKAGVWPPRYKKECVVNNIVLDDFLEPKNAERNAITQDKLEIQEPSFTENSLQQNQEFNLQFSQLSTQIVTIPTITQMDCSDANQDQIIPFC